MMEMIFLVFLLWELSWVFKIRGGNNVFAFLYSLCFCFTDILEMLESFISGSFSVVKIELGVQDFVME